MKMKRSVIQLAGKTQVISLPSKWVKKHGIKKGDALEVSEKRNALICSTSKQVYHNQTKINISGLGPMAKRIIAAIYKAGFEEIEVAYSSAKELSLIQEVLA
ncbi:MAG: AbrB/MazE/SpoVT family DNA-binding domain-containing protein, partial [Candidatus Nanoarchaeia archaeon]